MATFTTAAAPHLTRVVVAPATPAAGAYAEARIAEFPAQPSLNLQNFGGKTIEHLTVAIVYVGTWDAADREQLDHSLAAGMEDTGLNNVLAQYFEGRRPSVEFRDSQVIEGPVPPRAYKSFVEGRIPWIGKPGEVVCLCLPRGVVLVDGDEGDAAPDSQHGLGGYHGSVHTPEGTMYYAVSVYAERGNGIDAFDAPWKNICAILYHELCEVRTDPDVEDAISAGNDPHAFDLLGWYSPQGGEIGDIPMELPGVGIHAVMQEVALADGSGTVPVQLMWSNAVGGPEGPVRRRRQPKGHSSSSAARAETHRS
jgi:hypothetical protein